MSPVRRRLWLLLLASVLLAAGINLSLCPTLAAPTDSLLITGDGVAGPVTFTIDQLLEMPQYEHIYSTINTFPTKSWYIARGVNLKELLDIAGLSTEARLVRFYSNDGYEVTLTVQELLRDSRYYYPNLKDNHPSDGSIPGSTRGALEVAPILALQSAEGQEDPSLMNDRDSLLLVLGQRVVTEQTNNLYLKYVSRIEVLTEAPLQWDPPKADIDSGEAPVGTMIKLNNRKGDVDKIHYTTDGSTPTIESPMYNWIASRWLIQRDGWELVNRPIEINEDMVIKAITIGPGKTDSEVVTYTYQADSTGKEIDLQRGKPPGITLDQVAINLKKGASEELLARVNWGGGPEQELLYSSSDSRVITVDSQGLITRIGQGSASVAVTSADGRFSAVCLVYDPANPPDADELAVTALGSNSGTPAGQSVLPAGAETEGAETDATEIVPEPVPEATEPQEAPAPLPEEPEPQPEEPEPAPVPEGRGQYLADSSEITASAMVLSEQVVIPDRRVYELSMGELPVPEARALLLMDVGVVITLVLLLLAGALDKYRFYAKEINK